MADFLLEPKIFQEKIASANQIIIKYQKGFL